MSAVAYFGTLAAQGTAGPSKALQGGRMASGTFSPGEVDYGTIGQGTVPDGLVEAGASCVAVADGTLGYMGLYGIQANSLSTASFSSYVHVNNADTAVVAVRTPGSTANVTDTVNTAPVTAGQTIVLRNAADSGGIGTITPTMFALWFGADSGHACHYTGGASSASNGAGATGWVPVIGLASYSATVHKDCSIVAAGTLQTGRLNVAANATTGTSTITLMVNGVASSLVFSITAGATGVITSTGSAAVAVDDLVEWEVVNGGGGTLTFNPIHVGFVGDGPANNVTWSGNGSISAGASVEYVGLIGGGASNATEAYVQVAHGFTGTSSNLQAQTNGTLSGDVTVRFRKNGGNGTQVLVMPNGGSGIYEYTSGTDSFDADDLCNYSVIRSSGSGTQNLDWITTKETWVSG